MVSTNYYSMPDFGPRTAISSPVNGKQKTSSGKKSVFRRRSIGKNASGFFSGSVEGSSGFSEEFRDEMPSSKPENKNRNKNNNRTGNPDIHGSDGIKFDPFASLPSWGFDDNERTQPPKEFEAFQIQSPEDFEPFHLEPRARSPSKAKRGNNEFRTDSSPIISSIIPAASKLDKWSKSLTRKKNKKQFLYHSFTNEKRVSRSKKNSKDREAITAIEPPVSEPPLLEPPEIERLNFFPTNFSSTIPESFPSLNDGPVMNDLFPPGVRDDCQGNLIGPLMPNTKLKLAIQESPKNLSIVPDFADAVEPPCEDLVLESVFLKKEKNAPDDNEGSKCEKKNVETEEDKESIYETPEYPSEFEHSTVFSGGTENLPLLRAFGMKMVDCENCGNSKEQKKKKAKKKRAEVRKKMIEEIWERKHFYWKYESVEVQTSQHLEQMDTLVFKIAPELDDGRDDDIIEMPLGFQLSTITEGDEDVDGCCSPRSNLARSFQHNGKGTLNSPVDSILDMTNRDDEDEVEAELLPREPGPQSFNNEAPENLMQEQSKKFQRNRRRMRVLSLDEIEIRKSFDDGSAGGSRGNISDITEDYLHIPFSSPLYKKVLKAFREAEAAHKVGKKETPKEVQQYLEWV